MAKVFLISSNVTQAPYPVYPLGMAMVASDLAANGHEVVQWDYLAEGESMEKLKAVLTERSPEVVGICIRNIDNCNYTNSTAYTDFYREIVGLVRSLTTSPVVLGGPGYSLFPETLLKAVGGDYGIAGEGEGIFATLVSEIVSGRSTGLPKILRTTRPVTGDEIGTPDRNASYVDYYIKNGGMMNIQTKRGCPLKCAYCSYPALEGKSYRYRPAKDVVDEIEMLKKKFDMDYYFIADSVYNDPSGHYLEITEELVRRSIDVSWMAYFKPGHFKADDVKLLKRSGLKAVEWGTDASTDTTLKGLNKSFSWSAVVESNRLFSSVGISCAHFIIFGGPDETKETVEEGLANIESLTDAVVFSSTGVRVIPGTPIYDRALKEGVVEKDSDLLDPYFYFSSAVDAQYIDEAIKSSFGNRIDRIYPLEQDTEKIKAFHMMGYRGPVWDLLLGRKTARVRKRAQ